MSRKNGSHDSNNYKTRQKTYSSRNFYPIYENFNNYYRYLINGQQLSQPLPNYNYQNFLYLNDNKFHPPKRQQLES
jgi:hypothetical protein